MREIFGDAWSKFSRFTEQGIGFERHDVENADTHANSEFRRDCVYGCRDFAQGSRSVLKRTTILPPTCVGAEEFMQQITVTMFDIHKIGTDIRRDSGSRCIVIDQSLYFVIGKDLRVTRNAKLLIKYRMPVRHAGLGPFLVIRATEPSGVGKLKPDNKIIGPAKALLVSGQQCLA